MNLNTVTKKTKYIDVSVSCIRFDDTKWEDPLDKVFDIAYANGADNILFVLGKDTFNQKTSFSGVYEILTDKHMVGLSCSIIEPINYSSKIDYSDNEAVENDFNELKENLVTHIVELFDHKTSQKNNSLPPLLDVYAKNKPLVLAKRKLSNKDPFKRNILLVIDNNLGILEDDLCQKVIDQLVNKFLTEGRQYLSYCYKHAYFWYKVTEYSAKSKNMPIEKYINSGYHDDEEIVKEMLSTLCANHIVLEDGRDSVDFDTSFDTADGEDISSVSKLCTDELIERLFIEKKPEWIDYISKDKDYLNNNLGDLEELYTAKIEKENLLSDIEEIEHEYDLSKDNEWMFSHEKMNFSNYDENRFSELVRYYGTTVLIDYKIDDPEKSRSFLFPDTILTKSESEDFLSETSDRLEQELINSFEIVDGEIRTIE